MRRGYVTAVGLTLVLGIALACARAQSNQSEGQDAVAERLEKLEARVTMLQTLVEKSDREIQAKLATVLQNQEKIIRELEIVKVRATR